jgi:ribosomal protein S4
MMLSINKSKLQQLVVNLNHENENVLIPGSSYINIRKNKEKTYTDSGEQMIMRFQLKRFFNTKTLDSYDNLINRLDSILFRSHKVSSIKEARFLINKKTTTLPYNIISFKNIKPERILAHKIKSI